MTVAIRITADTQELSDAVRLVLEAALGEECRLQRGRVGTNPKYKDKPQVLAYGELDVRIPGEVLERVRAEGFSFPRRAPRR